MSESEVRKAQLEVERSTARLENALDHLITRIEEGTERVEAIRDQALKVKGQVEIAAHDPKGAFDRIADPVLSKAEQYVAERRVEVENYVSDRARLLQDQLRTTLDQAFNDTGRLVGNFMNDLRDQADETLTVLETHPVATWMTAFLTGCLAGVLIQRQALQQARQAPVSKKLIPLPTRESRQPKAA